MERNNVTSKLLVCIYCFTPEKIPNYFKWKAVQHTADSLAWQIVEVTQCCAHLANSVPIATFFNHAHNAEQNAKEAARRHNMEADSVRDLVDRARVVFARLLCPHIANSKRDPQSTMNRYICTQLQKSLNEFPVSKPRRPLSSRVSSGSLRTAKS